MAMSRTFAVDAGISVSLACALGIVLIADRGRGPEAHSGGVSITRQEEARPAAPAEPLRLAVTPRQYDDMGKLLLQLGSGFHYTDISLDDLLDISKISKYDVIFLTCGAFPEDWALDDAGGRGRGRARAGGRSSRRSWNASAPPSAPSSAGAGPCMSPTGGSTCSTTASTSCSGAKTSSRASPSP